MLETAILLYSAISRKPFKQCSSSSSPLLRDPQRLYARIFFCCISILNIFLSPLRRAHLQVMVGRWIIIIIRRNMLSIFKLASYLSGNKCAGKILSRKVPLNCWAGFKNGYMLVIATLLYSAISRKLIRLETFRDPQRLYA